MKKNFKVMVKTSVGLLLMMIMVSTADYDVLKNEDPVSVCCEYPASDGSSDTNN